MTSSYEANFSSVRPLFSALEGGMLAVFRGVAYNVSFSPVDTCHVYRGDAIVGAVKGGGWGDVS
jgi:hypothetical protein